MKSSRIAIVDYGLGNIFNVLKAFEHLGIDAFVSDSPSRIDEADGVVLPGVGSFSAGMNGLRTRRLDRTVKAYATSGRPLLGICLGMQMLMEAGTESGQCEGLGLVPGQVVSLRGEGMDHVKIPHMGWAAVRMLRPFPITSVKDRAMFYFVHSFFVEPREPGNVIAESIHGSRRFCSILARDNIVGCQFHPEKSGDEGLALLAGFASMVGSRSGGLI